MNGHHKSVLAGALIKRVKLDKYLERWIRECEGEGGE